MRVPVPCQLQRTAGGLSHLRQPQRRPNLPCRCTDAAPCRRPCRRHPAPQARHFGWLRDAYLLSSRGKFRVAARVSRSPGRRQIELTCFLTLSRDSLSSALISGTFLWKNPDIPVGAGWLGWCSLALPVLGATARAARAGGAGARGEARGGWHARPARRPGGSAPRMHAGSRVHLRPHSLSLLARCPHFSRTHRRS